MCRPGTSGSRQREVRPGGMAYTCVYAYAYDYDYDYDYDYYAHVYVYPCAHACDYTYKKACAYVLTRGLCGG
jgi:hypothetical protein